jgi:sugar fermentation stimulation protein A
VVLFIVQRSDCGRFTAADDIDPKFAKALAVAMAAGVEALVYSCKVTLENIAVTARIAP